jgi:hypothetical protein
MPKIVAKMTLKELLSQMKPSPSQRASLPAPPVGQRVSRKFRFDE